MRRLAVAVLAIAALTAGLISSCKQSDGERCQRQSDCSGGLVCVQATGLCQSSQAGADGNIEPDANVDGGPTIDAAIDAQIDAGPVDAAIN
jgi:hypothetical protein